jgi:hypothetical protein
MRKPLAALCTLSTMIMLALGLGASTASAANVECPPDPAEGSVINGNLVVKSGDFCFVNQVTVNGNVIVSGAPDIGPSFTDLGFSTVNGRVIVNRGGEINIHDTHVTKGLTGSEAGYVLIFSSQLDRGLNLVDSRNGLGFLCATAVGGGVTVSGTTSSDFPITIGDPDGDCVGNRIKGDLSLTQNQAQGIVRANSIDRNVTVSDNPSPTPFDISNNTIGGTLACFGNAASPTGGGNSAKQKLGQCARL